MFLVQAGNADADLLTAPVTYSAANKAKNNTYYFGTR